MRNRIAVWGRDAQENRVLITIELQVTDNIVRIQTYPEKVVSDEIYKSFMDNWRKGKEAELPEPDRVVARELSVTEGLLPDDLKAEQTDMILRAQTEWHYHVLSAKLAETYKSELAEIEDRIERAGKYSSDLWNQAKNFWQKVQGQLQDKTLLREQGNEIRKRVDQSFEKLKEMRDVLNAEYKEESTKQVAKFTALLQDAETRIGEGTHLNKVFNDLRDIQKKFHNVKFTKEDRDAIYKRIDAAFKAVKEKRGQGGGESRNLSRTQSRLDGLLKAMNRMKSGIGRDQEDLKFERRRIERTNGQLEKQIREAKVVMIESRIASKQTKLDDMEKTKVMLEKKIEQEKKKAEKRAKKDAERAAAEAAKAKIAADMATRVVSPAETAKLEAAAAAIQAGKKKGGRTRAADRVPAQVKNFIAYSEIISGEAAAPAAPAADVTPPAPASAPDTAASAASEVTAAAAAAGAGAVLVDKQAATVAEAIAGTSPTVTAAEVAAAAVEQTEAAAPTAEPTLAERAGDAIAGAIVSAGDAYHEATAEGSLLDQIGDALTEAGDAIADKITDVTDTARAAAQVAGEHLEAAAERAEDALEDAVDTAKEKISGEEE